MSDALPPGAWQHTCMAPGDETACRGCQAQAAESVMCEPHRRPQGPNEDVAVCPKCHSLSHTMRPVNEQFGLHADDCSLHRLHQGACKGGGEGHPVAPVVRGWWPNMDADVLIARIRHGNVDG